MKNFVTMLTYSTTLLAIAFAGPLKADDEIESSSEISWGCIQGSLQAGLGYRQDSIVWKVRDLEKVNPSAATNTHFKDLEIVLVGAKFRGLLIESVYTRASFDYGWIVDGNVREDLSVRQRHESVHFDNNGLLTEGCYNKAVTHNKEKSDSYVWDFNIAFGVPFGCLFEGFQIAPLVGFSYDRQQIRVRNKECVYSTFECNFPRIISCDDLCETPRRKNSYKAAWWGPWIGFDFAYAMGCWNIFGEFELHYGRVERERNAIIGVQYLDRYSRTKTFWGTTTRLGANYMLNEKWYLEATLGYTHLTSSVHRDSLYFSSGTVRLDAGRKF